VRPRLGGACTTDGNVECTYAEDPCTSPSFVCTSGTWHQSHVNCPVSSARYKEDIAYLDEDALRRVSEEVRSMRLATWRYKDGAGDPGEHLGFIIEDAPGSHAVLSGQSRVDLYSYTSMAVAALQLQAREIESLRKDVQDLRREAARCR
jgi:hypothetical protein